jgi:hypothetical protein
MTVGLTLKECNKSEGEHVVMLFGNVSAPQIRVAYPLAETAGGLYRNILLREPRLAIGPLIRYGLLYG